MKLVDKKILITGATSGIGLKLVEKLYLNNSIYIIARNNYKINELQSRFPNIKAYKADFSNIYELEATAKEINGDIKHLDVLINNAAIQYTPTLISNDFTFDSINHEITTNFTAVCSLCYLLLPLLNQQHHSIILNINSGLGLVPKTTSAIYCATKGALNIFSQSLRHQLKKTFVEVQQVFLPLVDTPMTKGRGNSKMSVDKVSTEIIKGMEKGIIEHDIGKVKLLRIMSRLLPVLAKEIMRGS